MWSEWSVNRFILTNPAGIAWQFLSSWVVPFFSVGLLCHTKSYILSIVLIYFESLGYSKRHVCIYVCIQRFHLRCFLVCREQPWWLQKKTILYFAGLTFPSEANADHIWSGLLIKYDQQFWTNIHAVRCTLRCVNEEKWKIMNCSFVQFFYTAP